MTKYFEHFLSQSEMIFTSNWEDATGRWPNLANAHVLKVDRDISARDFF